VTNRRKYLTASNIKYLLVLYELCGTSGETRCVRVAQTLGLSKPSVHTMIDTLKGRNLVHKDLYGMISLTAAGTELAKKYADYYGVISAWLEPVLCDSIDKRIAVCAILAEMSPERLQEMCMKLSEQEKSNVS